MRGHLPLIAMRMRGRCPRAATIEVGKDTANFATQWPQFVPYGAGPWIEIAPTDRLSGIDLRCIVGMTVMVTGCDEARTLKVAELVLKAEAKACYATIHDPSNHRVIRGVYFNEQASPWQEF